MIITIQGFGNIRFLPARINSFITCHFNFCNFIRQLLICIPTRKGIAHSARCFIQCDNLIPFILFIRIFCAAVGFIMQCIFLGCMRATAATTAVLFPLCRINRIVCHSCGNCGGPAGKGITTAGRCTTGKCRCRCASAQVAGYLIRKAGATNAICISNRILLDCSV